MANTKKPENGTGNGLCVPQGERPVTHEELERAGQKPLRFKTFSEEEEERAVEWWAATILKAETDTGNTEAIRHPRQYLKTLKEKWAANDDFLEKLVEEYRRAAAAHTLDEPLWTEKIADGEHPRHHSRGAVV